MRFYARSTQVIAEAERQALVDGILHSEFFGESVLGSEFVATDGFSLVFQRSGLELVHRRFPFFKPLLEKTLFDTCNGFYVNPLVLYDGSRVDSHIDCRLLSPTDIRIIPNLVSVFYAEVPSSIVGGELVFSPNTEDEIRLSPRTGDLVHFLGSVIHRVESLTRGVRRISVVCEQYNLSESTLASFPVCDLIASGSRQVRVNGLVVPEQ